MGNRAWLLAAGLVLASSLRAEEDPAALLPKISLPDEKITSLEATGRVRLFTHRYDWRILYKAPDRYALFLWGRPDKVPIACFAGGRILVYDPLRSTIWIGSASCRRAQLGMKKDNLVFRLTYSYATNSDYLRLDFPSIAAYCNAKTKRIDQDGGRVLWTGQSDAGEIYEAVLDPKAETPLVSFTVHAGDPEHPMFRIDEIKLNGEIPDEAFRFPDLKKLKKDFKGKVKRLPETLVRARAYYDQVIDIRSGINFEKLRKQVQERQRMDGTVWATAKASDDEFARKLKRFLPHPKAQPEPDPVKKEEVLKEPE